MMTRDCQVCAEYKPHFYCPDKAQLIKATRPFERLSVDFKGPLPSTDRNIYFLNIIDEYSRLPFAIPRPDTTTTSIIKALNQLFTLLGYPCYIHSDRGSSFMSDELRQYLLARGIATSRTTSYNPRGNGQVERENATVWKATLLALKSKGLPVPQWQEVLPEAFHSIRSLLCTSTNATPHERLFSFPRKSATGTTLPAWLTSSGPVLPRKYVRSNKYSPLVERDHLLHANPQYAYVVLPDGWEDTVSVRNLASAGAADHYPEHSTVTMNPVPEVTPRTPSPTQTPHDTTIPGVSHAHIPGSSHTHEGSLTPSGLTPPVTPEPAQPLSPVESPPAPVQSQPVLRRLQ
ncbi:protein phosphatase 1 regulatory subunit 3C-B isoform X1 [Hypanus sabinus]|uniref:protein phosphatase 1 regulatory subunit 3C-B isoform X1 n=1 Tax=Hypanus sabinus TaxID=79690 RepID=UPI0028C3C24F|nr:protein phosphatase 1 regulatory subunit 3C-B isoform X1 [Hypanus sabinus]XP_059803518.1 protein phosphatase 1 regulatory subunit 3C-B isoform X1 [Hypanus sabinus]XP_059803519.1 protein phosphatase 1 regulatory subunit 3C-B isoform X1 [Hypanus sabinus]XP_059803520.1 protein phosphatase 1 regulatory subunit 3C-B isoform X1 [Hypanus sabinus]XP_059803521.1 protein phosphatase 1 regulatory subunit 3C-B isoform X1 [Hypanus sabinus]XP_059803522.1 protein phosphatase 1 regulatory subunit 3C-B isof